MRKGDPRVPFGLQSELAATSTSTVAFTAAAEEKN